MEETDRRLGNSSGWKSCSKLPCLRVLIFFAHIFWFSSKRLVVVKHVTHLAAPSQVSHTTRRDGCRALWIVTSSYFLQLDRWTFFPLALQGCTNALSRWLLFDHRGCHLRLFYDRDWGMLKEGCSHVHENIFSLLISFRSESHPGLALVVIAIKSASFNFIVIIVTMRIWNVDDHLGLSSHGTSVERVRVTKSHNSGCTRHMYACVLGRQATWLRSCVFLLSVMLYFAGKCRCPSNQSSCSVAPRRVHVAVCAHASYIVFTRMYDYVAYSKYSRFKN